ncbi:MAG: TonB-dependent receptor [Pseudomonadota bacterium]
MIARHRNWALLATAGLVALAAPAAAQVAASSPAEAQPGAPAQDDGGLTDIVVTASKSASTKSVQEVPFAVTAFGPQQLEEQHVQSLTGLSYSAPNVQIEDVGTQPGTANLSVRGLGVNSSIPSIDPTVGIFVDGVYLGIPAGALLDTFDLAGVEILRGPQGLLFGRNVTGGALVVRTTNPTDELHADFKVSVASGLDKTISGVVTGPIVQDRLSAKLAVYYNDDDGYFKNNFNGAKDLGKGTTLVIRPALRFTPSTDFETIIRYEHGRQRGDGAVASNHGLFARDSFGVSINEEGYSRNDWDQGIIETNIEVGLGNGRITNIFGYRDVKQRNQGDIDASPQTLFHSRTAIDQDQLSNELRYAGTFGNIEVTTGLYYFNQNIKYYEERLLSGGALRISGAGFQQQDSYGIFASADWHFTPTLTLNVGGRYTTETKRAQIANIVAGGCVFDTRVCNITFRDDNDWKGFTPRVGLQFKPTDQTQVYAFFARGFRSGGYNFRNVNTAVRPGPFDQETQDSYEIGLKQEFGRMLRLNLAAYSNTIANVQREIQTPVPGVGTFQVIANSADAKIQGFEAEALLRVGGGLSLSGQVGYTHGKYDTIFLDLNNDRVIDAKDFALKLPRLAPWSYGGAVSFDTDIGDLGGLSARVSANHRDAAWYNDQNTGLLRAATMVDANLSITRGRTTVSVFGTNLLNEATFGTEAPLPFIPNGTFSSLNKGRVYGAELRYRF